MYIYISLFIYIYIYIIYILHIYMVINQMLNVVSHLPAYWSLHSVHFSNWVR